MLDVRINPARQIRTHYELFHREGLEAINLAITGKINMEGIITFLVKHGYGDVPESSSPLNQQGGFLSLDTTARTEISFEEKMLQYREFQGFSFASKFDLIEGDVLALQARMNCDSDRARNALKAPRGNTRIAHFFIDPQGSSSGLSN